MTFTCSRVPNGTFTIQNRASGEHQTFRIARQRDNARFRPGERLLSRLAGPDNQHDYLSLGVVTDDGVEVWKKHHHTRNEDLAHFVFRILSEGPGEDFELLMEERCIRCNRKLTHPISIKTGIGPICAGRYGDDYGIPPLLRQYLKLEAQIKGTV